jgi:hypothetical protein
MLPLNVPALTGAEERAPWARCERDGGGGLRFENTRAVRSPTVLALDLRTLELEVEG